MHTIAYIGFCCAKSIAEPTNIVYNNICITGINALNTYSLSHIVNACACPSFILSRGYVSAINGAIIVKKAKYTNLFK